MKLLHLFGNLVFVFVVCLSMPFVFMGLREIGRYLGLVPLVVPVAGTGSMYPSLYWSKSEGGLDDERKTSLPQFRLEPKMYHYFRGFSLFGHTYFQSTLGRGDMVAFQNDNTKKILAKDGVNQNASFIKRLIGLPGDTIELRDGYVLVNGEKITEPYIASPRSTYGDTNLADCVKLVVPPQHYFVLGDNRKASLDSRAELGLVADSDILFYLPLAKQSIYHPFWRDVSNDAALAQTATLDIAESLRLINSYRQTKNTKNLTLNQKLTKSASLRASNILLHNDFSVTASASGYTFSKAMNEVSYNNVITNEIISRGFYTAKEWVDSLTYFHDSANEISNQYYQDIGIAVKSSEINGCPTQVIVAHFGGYMPPNYDQATLDSWRQLKNDLQEIINMWQKIKDYPAVDQEKLARLLTILNTRLALATEIENAISHQKWLTKDQEDRIIKDEALAVEADNIIKSLNDN